MLCVVGHLSLYLRPLPEAQGKINHAPCCPKSRPPQLDGAFEEGCYRRHQSLLFLRTLPPCVDASQHLDALEGPFEDVARHPAQSKNEILFNGKDAI